MQHLAALGVWIASGSAVFAAPWQTEEFKTSVISNYSAAQSDAGEDFFLVVECQPPGIWSVYVESPFDWRNDITYPVQVATAFEIDGKVLDSLAFGYYNRQFGEGIVAFAADQQAAFTVLLDAMSAARSAVTMRYADRSASFSSEGSAAAIRWVRERCK